MQSVFRIPVEWIPKEWHPENFRSAWTVLPFPLFVVNTLIVTCFAVVGQVLSASLVAYGFARFNFPGKRLLFVLVLSTMLLPAQVTMIPVFIIWQKLGLVDTFAPLTIPAYLGGGAFTIFLLRQFYLTIPRELDEAAMIDGCSYFGIWRHIILPLSRPALITVLLFAFMANWDDFMSPLIYLHSQEKLTVSIGLRLFQDQYGQTNLPLLMAASVLHITPVVIIFLIGQRYFIKGIVMTGLKG
jgi:multiple sugar transport system permease protein